VKDLQITGQGTWFSVLYRGHVVADRLTSHGNAIAALPGIQARLRPVRIIRCMGCPTHFKSTGKGHRLCPQCRKLA
jgi:hypothetical protein